MIKQLFWILKFYYVFVLYLDGVFVHVFFPLESFFVCCCASGRCRGYFGEVGVFEFDGVFGFYVTFESLVVSRQQKPVYHQIDLVGILSDGMLIRTVDEPKFVYEMVNGTFVRKRLLLLPTQALAQPTRNLAETFLYFVSFGPSHEGPYLFEDPLPDDILSVHLDDILVHPLITYLEHYAHILSKHHFCPTCLELPLLGLVVVDSVHGFECAGSGQLSLFCFDFPAGFYLFEVVFVC